MKKQITGPKIIFIILIVVLESLVVFFTMNFVEKKINYAILIEGKIKEIEVVGEPIINTTAVLIIEGNNNLYRINVTMDTTIKKGEEIVDLSVLSENQKITIITDKSIMNEDLEQGYAKELILH